MKRFYDGKTSSRERREAFALIVALGLMSFIFLLILSLSTLVRLESQVGTTQGEQRMARQNALLGLQVAMGQLQEMAGPDQRVTGTAGLIEGMSEPQHANWTGVWDVSGRNPYDAFAAPATLGWLVSGTDNGGSSLEPGVSVRDSITIVGEGSVDDPDSQVEVGRVAISSDGSETGHFAYWVSDEGVKAKINLSDPHREAPSGDDAQKRYSLMSAQRNGIEAISSEAATDGKPLGEVIDPQDATVKSQLTRLASVNQLGILNNSLDDVRKIRFHDLTTSSNGLLTNTASGGLKKDLSLAFEMDVDDFNDNTTFAAYESIPNLTAHQVNYLFKFDQFDAPTPSTADAMVRGPTWHLLRNYYRLYKTEDPDRFQSYKTGNPLGVEPDGGGYKIAARPYFPTQSNNSSKYGRITEGYYYATSEPVVRNAYTYNGNDIDLGRETDMPINPVMLRAQFFMSMPVIDVTPEETTPGVTPPKEYQLDLRISPVITIWNPYNVKLEFSSLVVLLVNPTIATTVRVESDTTENYAITDMLKDESIELTLASSGGGSVTLDPGEIMTFAMTDNIDFSGTKVSSTCAPYSGSVAQLPGILYDTLDQDNSRNLIVGEDDVLSITGGASSFINTYIRLGRSVGGSNEIREVQSGRLNVSETINWPGEGGVTLAMLDASGLLAEPITFGVLDMYLKPASDNNPVQFLTHYNPRATTFMRATGLLGYSIFGEDAMNPGNWGFSYNALSGTNITNLPSPASWGDDYSSGHTRVVLFDLPTLPLQSLGTLQHVNNVSHYAQNPAYPIGNSYANPFIGPEAVTRTISATRAGSTSEWTQVDWSYLSNTALWDEYFFSTLVPRADLGMDDGDWNTFVTGFADGTYELANARIRLLPGVDTEAFVATVLGSATGDSIAPDAYEKVAMDLTVDGAFNVNSTSVEAWKALLSSTNGLDVTYLDSSGGSERTANSQSNPYTRLSLPDDRAEQPWTGFRALTDAQIQDLAEAIVEQVKERGPFVSLSDFVNRRLADDDTGLKGPLQAAIDATNINDDFNYNVNNSDISSSNLGFPEHAVGPTESGATGYLRQADLLQTLGPVLTARSDTFVIRAYGDSVNPITGAEMRAWCEAVVQRMPEYVDETDAADKAANLSAINERFGRRFEIVSFRWLSEDQI
ncbi:MAG: hypothetical protein Q7Q73_16420 [Verrucomicrobiota bacterium JB024]|nr:hypothetical protein [Verrucomicrobiota bacterium JB024]